MSTEELKDTVFPDEFVKTMEKLLSAPTYQGLQWDGSKWVQSPLPELTSIDQYVEELKRFKRDVRRFERERTHSCNFCTPEENISFLEAYSKELDAREEWLKGYVRRDVTSEIRNAGIRFQYHYIWERKEHLFYREAYLKFALTRCWKGKRHD